MKTIKLMLGLFVIFVWQFPRLRMTKMMLKYAM